MAHYDSSIQWAGCSWANLTLEAPDVWSWFMQVGINIGAIVSWLSPQIVPWLSTPDKLFVKIHKT